MMDMDWIFRTEGGGAGGVERMRECERQLVGSASVVIPMEKGLANIGLLGGWRKPNVGLIRTRTAFPSLPAMLDCVPRRLVHARGVDFPPPSCRLCAWSAPYPRIGDWLNEWLLCLLLLLGDFGPKKGHDLCLPWNTNWHLCGVRDERTQSKAELASSVSKGERWVCMGMESNDSTSD
ncbi:hypothetical protein BD324DRAFT_636328 [Kockovaella imperatae]|uniref:Uncharacterized protein n=1 Tax=Kockovaella imperatae TaxID=4999 RepID=A0A1Y1U925_9TREE|nr:hypothetical protein BD324DRAFT_636328 [Kockovaella imperatae]ORX34543.1 hypothetical protein BD324DRAFT_636328 [Kockovaella imperatae]